MFFRRWMAVPLVARRNARRITSASGASAGIDMEPSESNITRLRASFISATEPRTWSTPLATLNDVLHAAPFSLRECSSTLLRLGYFSPPGPVKQCPPTDCGLAFAL